MTPSDSQDHIVQEVCRFASEVIVPQAGDFDKTGVLPRRVIEELAHRKLLLASLPESAGGLGLDPLCYGYITEALGKACCSTVGLLTVHCSLVGETLQRWGSEALRNEWLPRMAKGEAIGAFALSEPEIGTDAQSVQTQYRPDGNAYVLDGRKKWISFGGIADFFLVIAAHGSDITAFLVDRKSPGIRTRPIRGLLARRASHVAEIDFDHVVVPKEHVVGQPGSGFTYVVGTALDHGRYSIAWSGVALAQAGLEAMVRYARKRKQFSKRLCEFQLVQGMIGDAVTQTHAARALCIQAGMLRQQGSSHAMAETNIAKYFTSKVAMDIAQNAVQVHGGNGCCSDYPVERYFREAKVLEIIEGTSQIQQQLIARYGLRQYGRR
jgi:alkylation response protein AidB-like acyl-CoA dehydrogenase